MNSIRYRRGVIALAAVTALLLLLPATASAGRPGADPARTVVDVQSLGEVRLPVNPVFDETLIGGLSSITYDQWRGVYYALSDDQADFDPVRYYTLAIDFADGSLDDGDIEFLSFQELFEERRSSFAPNSLDPEGFVVGPPGHLWMSSEGLVNTNPIVDPFIRRYNRQGRVTAELPIPDKYLPNGTDWGVRHNLGFESLNLTPDRRYLVTANEDALFQDGPAAGNTNGSLARILVYDQRRRQPLAEYVYPVNQFAEPTPAFGVNGIVEVLPIDDQGTMLVMERSFSLFGSLGGGTGNNVKIYEVSTQGATDVLGVDALYDGGFPIAFDPVSKREIFDFEGVSDKVYNIEGMTFGPTLPDGRRSLVIVSDDNFALFSPDETQFFVLALDIQDQ